MQEEMLYDFPISKLQESQALIPNTKELLQLWESPQCLSSEAEMLAEFWAKNFSYSPINVVQSVILHFWGKDNFISQLIYSVIHQKLLLNIYICTYMY